MNNSSNVTRRYRRSAQVFRVILLCLSFGSSASQAYNFHEDITELEYLSSSSMCKLAISSWNANNNYALAFVPRVAKDKDRQDLIHSVGGWHYCGGAIKISRADMASTKEEKKRYLESGLADAHYSYKTIDKNNPWAAEMGTTIALGFSKLNMLDKAYEYLDSVLKYHPNYRLGYLTYGLIYYRNKDYLSAQTYFQKANKVGGKASAEATYFLGLVAVKLNDIEGAKRYALQAKQLGYPLTGLDRLIARSQNK